MGHETHEHGHEHGGAHGHEHPHAHGGVAAHGHAHEGAHAHGHEHPALDDVAPERPFGGPRRKVAIGGGVELAVVERGGGAPTLFLHGFPTSASLFRKTIAALGDRARSIAPDLLGFGESEGPVEGPFDLMSQAGYVLRLLDALEIPEATIVGHDWGGSIAQILAARHPERVARLVLCDCPAFDFVPPPRLRLLARTARLSFLWDLLCDTGAFRAFARSPLGFREGAYDKAAISDEAIDHYISPLFRDTPPAYRAARERFRRAVLAIYGEAPAATLAAVEGLRRFSRPTLVVWGCEDPYISVSYAKKLADEIPGCTRLELFAFCGHWVPEERPIELANAIAELAALPAPPEPVAV